MQFEIRTEFILRRDSVGIDSDNFPGILRYAGNGRQGIIIILFPRFFLSMTAVPTFAKRQFLTLVFTGVSL